MQKSTKLLHPLDLWTVARAQAEAAQPPFLGIDYGALEHTALVLALQREGGKVEVLKRVFGLDRGKFVVPDGFNDPLPDDILEEFYR